MHVAVDEAGSHQEPAGIDGVAGFPWVQMLLQCDDLAAAKADVPRIVQALGGIDHPAVVDQKVIFHGSWCSPPEKAVQGLQTAWSPDLQIDLSNGFKKSILLYHAWTH